MAKLPQSYLDSAAAMAAAAAATGTNKKTLVCLFLFGGIDSHNMLIPTSGTNKTLYDTWRPVPETGIALTEEPLNDLGGQWRLHPRLGARSPLAGSMSIHDMWVSNRVAIVRNVGTLIRPTTRAEYISDPTVRPKDLFSHNSQQDQWMYAERRENLKVTGWFGRVAALLDPSFNPSQTVDTSSMSTSNIKLQSRTYGAANVPVFPPTLMTSMPSLPGSNNAASRGLKMYQASEQNSPADLNPAAPYTPGIGTPANVAHNGTRDIFISAIRAQRAANTAYLALPGNIATYFNTTNLPNLVDGFGKTVANPFRTQFETAARIIWSRAQNSGEHLMQRRQVIFISVGGWDHHLDLRKNQDWRLEAMSQAVGNFWKAMQDMTDPTTGNPLSESVVLFTESEFSRTFKANTTFGTDHAWAGHSFVFGSENVISGGFHGPVPDYTIGAGRDVDTNLGRYIPDISTEQYYSTLLKWMDVPIEQRRLVLPYLDQFTPQTLDFLNTPATYNRWKRVFFDGTNDYMMRSTALAGEAATYQAFTLVIKFRLMNEFGGQVFFDANGGSGFALRLTLVKDASVTMMISTLDEATFTIGKVSTDVMLGQPLPAEVDHTLHIAFRNDSGNQRIRSWLNGVPLVNETSGFLSPGQISLPGAGFTAFAASGGAHKCNTQVGLLWFKHSDVVANAYIDDPSLFYSNGDTRLPVNGAVKGIKPSIFFGGDYQTADTHDIVGASGGWNDGKNHGTGGDFVMIGSVTNVT
jgi:uncharacterized protein (DUF1501 family)